MVDQGRADRQDADVVICGDNDEPGRGHVMLVAANLHGIARRLRVLDLAKFWPEIQESDDITDWFAAGGTAERLWEMVEQLSSPKDPLACIEPPEASSTEENHTEHANTSARRRLLPPPSMPIDVARVFVADHCIHDGTLTLRHWRGGWWRWRSSHWREVPDRGVRSLLYHFTADALYLEGGALVPWAPNRKKVGDLFEALAAICILSDDTDQPCWLDDRASSVSVIVAMANGLLDVEGRQLLPHTPLYFNQVAVPFDYDPTAPPPQRWHDFLDELWPNEPEAIDAMGEWLGYVISGRAAFVREKCELGTDKQVDVDVLYTVYKQWAEDNGHVKMSKSLFGRDLRAAHPPIRKTRPRDKTGEDDRHHVYAGIALQKGERKAA